MADHGRDVPVAVAPTRTVAARMRWILVVGLLATTIVMFVLGSIAAAVGGDLEDWGDGAGGLGGWPDLFMTFFSFLVGLAAAIATFRERRSVLLSVAVFATGLLISTGYLVLAHLADPCVRGWWDSDTSVGDAGMCSPIDEIASRFHLLLHGSFGMLAAGVAAVIYRRTDLTEWWPWAR